MAEAAIEAAVSNNPALAWQKFVATGSVPPELDRAIARSWERCRARLSPVDPPVLVRAIPAVFDRMVREAEALLNLARPVMEDVAQAVEGSGHAILLANAAGCVLWEIGDPDAIAYLESKGIQPGVYLAEYATGTNSVALAFHESMPVQVVGPQHYLQRWHDLAEASAPVYSVTGRAVGVVAMMAHVGRHQHHAVGAVAAAARAIESELRFEWLLGESQRHLTALNATLEAIGDGIMAWDAQGRITHLNGQAATLLSIDPVRALGRPLWDHVQLPAPVSEAIRAGQGLQDVEVVFQVRTGGRTRRVNCFTNLRIIYGGESSSSAFIMSLRPAERVRRLIQRMVGYQSPSSLDHLVGDSPAIRQLRRQALAAARGRAPVLITGEPGVGKNFIARCIHTASSRRDGPFVAVNCLAIPRNLATREILGWEGGSGVGQPSKFELADGGTLYLDDLDALPLEVQAALMRVITSGELMRLGSRDIIQVNVRIIASCTPDVERRVREGSLLPELYHTLRPFMLVVPSLRERPEDIPALIEDVLRRLSTATSKQLKATADCVDVLTRYPWPGNVRELELVLERAAALSETDHINVDALPDTIRSGRLVALREGRVEPVLTMEEAEREAIIRAAWATGGQVTQMASLLQIGRTTLWRKLRALGIDPRRYRENGTR
ncbi:MAG: PTS-dependent dihydroxyacetone kinase operon transcriptional regulator DhaR [Meiothermus sp.]